MSIMQKLFESPEAIIAFFALVTSIASIYFTFHSLRAQKEHNLMSVRPIGIISAVDFDNNIYVGIKNNGIGPLIISDFKVSKSGFETTHLMTILPENIQKINWTDYVSDDIIMIGSVIKPGEELYLIQLTFDISFPTQNANEEIKIELWNSLKDLTIEMTYTDIYEKQKFSTKRKLNWFGRHFEKGEVIYE
jgi:hypothetical protein